MTAERAADSCLFIPVPYEIKYGDAEKSGLELIAGARDREDRTQAVTTDIDNLEKTIEQVLDMLERVTTYVSNVLDEEAEPSSALGQYLMNTLSLAPKVEAEDIENSLYVLRARGEQLRVLREHCASRKTSTYPRRAIKAAPLPLPKKDPVSGTPY